VAKNKNQKEHFWSNGLSIDETKVSILIICLLIGVVLGALKTFKCGDFPPGIVEFIKICIIAITGINLSNRFLPHNDKDDD